MRAVQGIAEAGQGKDEAADKTVKAGCYVKIAGLKNRPELNDVVGVVLQIEEGSAVVATQVVLRSGNFWGAQRHWRIVTLCAGRRRGDRSAAVENQS